MLRPLQHPLDTTNRLNIRASRFFDSNTGPESKPNLNEETVRVVPITLVRYNLHVLDDDGSLTAARELMPNEHHVMLRATHTLNDFTLWHFTFWGAFHIIFAVVFFLDSAQWEDSGTFLHTG